MTRGTAMSTSCLTVTSFQYVLKVIFSVLTGSVLADQICFKLALARFSTSVLAGFGENGILRFLTHSRDLGAKLGGNGSYGRRASFRFS